MTLSITSFAILSRTHYEIIWNVSSIFASILLFLSCEIIAEYHEMQVYASNLCLITTVKYMSSCMAVYSFRSLCVSFLYTLIRFTDFLAN